MFKKILVVGFILLGGSQSLYAQAAVHPTQSPRFNIEDRVKSQYEGVTRCLKKKMITSSQASYCLGVLKSVEHRLKAGADLGNSKSMAQARYEAYNATLDMNSKLLHESKLTFFYFDSYGRHFL
ncbi:MAG TPA: hypothetical protein VN963_09715 [bacterium]|nr:hypothetical protein [bacterium]